MFTIANVSGSVREIMKLDPYIICNNEDRCLHQVAVYRNSAVFDFNFHGDYFAR